MNELFDAIDERKESFEKDLFELLRIPSVSTDSTKKDEIRKAANFLLRKINSLNPDHSELFETPGNPIVFGEFRVDPELPTILVYGHYDVQPPDPLDKWKTQPFEPTVKDGKVYARGASDDKGQSITHLQAVKAFRAINKALPVNLKFIYEGEEEIGSPNLLPFLESHKDLLACDMVVISDTAMFAKDTPSITYGLRGLAYMEIKVTGPNRDLHSGVYGGVVDNPANVLAELIAALKDKDGRITIPGFYDEVLELTETEREAYQKLPFDEQGFKDDLEVEALRGESGYSTLEWASGRPTLDVNGLWSGYQGEGAKTVLPSYAGAKVSMRLVPNQNPKKISQLFKDYLERIAPKSVKVEVCEHHGGFPVLVDPDYYGMKAASKAFEDVYGKSPLFTREGGSIPIVYDFKRVLGVNSILMGFGLNSDGLHSPNEHFHLIDYLRGIKTSARFMEVVASYRE